MINVSVTVTDTGMLTEFYDGRPSALEIKDGTFTAFYVGESKTLLSEDVMLGAVTFGHKAMQAAITAINELVAEVGVEAWGWEAAPEDEDLKAKKFVLSDESLFQKQLDMAEVRNQIENKVKEIEGQLKVDKYRIQEPLINKLREIINETGREQGFTMILQRGAAGVIYTREARDSTDLIIAQYNKK